MLRCPRCQRANPDDAGYCHYDGVGLQFVATVKHPERFFREWRFPTGRTCHTVDELVQGCLEEWPVAVAALGRKEFKPFFWDNGRHDLADLVPSNEADAELALQKLLEKLPTSVNVVPKLDIIPRRLLVSNVKRGEDRIAMLTLVNRGSGLLAGDLHLPDPPPWLHLPETRIRTRHEQLFELQIDSRSLPTTGSYFTKVQIRTNGGMSELPVQVDVSVPGIAFHGFSVTDPQHLARVMLDNPKQAAKWFNDGSIQELFAREGWGFPIVGPLASGMGAVQQYFEALRLSSTPKITVDPDDVSVVCEHGDCVTRSLTLSASTKKWVYAFATSDAMWLKLDSKTFAAAKQLEIPFTIDSEILEPGRTHEAVLHITYNGGVERTIWVRVDVRKPFEPWTRKLFKPFMT